MADTTTCPCGHPYANHVEDMGLCYEDCDCENGVLHERDALRAALAAADGKLVEVRSHLVRRDNPAQWAVRDALAALDRKVAT